MARESSRQDAGGCGGLLKDGCVVVPRTDDDRAEEEDAVEWKEVEGSGAIPIGRIGHSICYDGRGDLYLWGGVNDTVEGKYLADFFRYNFEKKEWTQVVLQGDEQPGARAFHSAVCYKGDVVIFGGCNGKSRFDQINLINCHTGKCVLARTTGTKPKSRYCHTSVEYKGRMLVFGGKNGGRSSNKRLSDILSYDFETRVWDELDATGEAPSSRSAHTSVVYGKKMLVFGGRDTAGGCCKDYYEFHLESYIWRMLKFNDPAELLVRARHTAVVHGDNVIVFGGWNGRKKLNDLCMYNLTTNTIKVIHDSNEEATLPCRRECHTTVVVNNTLMLFGGRFRGEFMNDNYEHPLAAPSLKYLLRNWFVKNNVPLPTLNFPSNLASQIDDYKKRFID